MEARFLQIALILASVCSLGASYRTPNFVVTAASPSLAKEIGDQAEEYRRRLAVEWLERELPSWRQPCPITAKVNPQLGAGGATSFMFRNNQPFGWEMTIQGSRERILDSVLPHEVTHTIFATHFGGPLPRWADEGACTTVEHSHERRKQEQWLIQFLKTRRGIPFNRMFAMSEYPHDIMPLYSQGYSLARFLINHGGKPRFIRFVGDGMSTNNWTMAVRNHYGFTTLGELQLTWVEWVKQGSPEDVSGFGSTTQVAVATPASNSTSIAEPTALVASTKSTADDISTEVGRPVSWYTRRQQGVDTADQEKSDDRNRVK